MKWSARVSAGDFPEVKEAQKEITVASGYQRKTTKRKIILLLILIVVASVSALSVMVSEAQKKEMEQRSLRAAVESENLKILSLALNDSDGDGYWNTIILNVVNLNTEGSRVVGLNINGRNAANYTDKDGVSYNFKNQFNVPPAMDSLSERHKSTHQSPCGYCVELSAKIKSQKQLQQS